MKVGVHGADHSEMPKFATVGIPREPSEFIARACTLTHPLLRVMKVGDALEEAINAYELGDRMEFRRIQCGYVRLCGELKDDEAKLHDRMPWHLQKVLKGKGLCLFHKLLAEIEYPDTKVASEMSFGFPLRGWLPESGVFPPKLQPPELHVDTLATTCASFTARTISATKPSGDDEMDQMLWRATMDEVQAGFLTGRFNTNEIPSGAVASPRFGLMQKSKLRPIDNFSASHINSATRLCDKLQVDSIDEICGMIKCWVQRSQGSTRLVGRCYDLCKAYRQIGICEDHLKFAWIAVWDPFNSMPQLFRMESMPFGATASVGAFLRVSQALKCLGITRAALVWSSFYHDLVCVCPEDASAQVDRMIRLFFQMLGWQLSTDETKDVAFSSKFQALGVEFDLTCMRKGLFTVGNTSARKAELREWIERILHTDELAVTEAASIRSRLLFADAQVFGRFAKSALHEIGKVSLAQRDMKPLTAKVRRSLVWMKERVLTGPPRKIDFEDSRTFYLFLDAQNPMQQNFGVEPQLEE